MPDEFRAWNPRPADPPAAAPPASAPRPAGPGWGIRERPARQPDPWEAAQYAPPAPVTTPVDPGARPVAPPPVVRPPAPGASNSAPPPSPVTPPPTGAQPFPTTRQVVAVLVVACVLVGSLGVYLFHSRGAPAAPLATVPPGGAVAVVHQGPAMLSQVSLSGGAAGKKLTLSGTPDGVVATPDGHKAFLLDSSHGQVIPVDLTKGTVGAPIPAGKLPTDESVSHDGATLYVTDNLGGSVIPIDTATDTPGAAQQLAQGVSSFTPAPTGSTAVVSANNAPGQPGIIGFYNTTSGLGSAVGVGQNNPLSVSYSPDGATVWVVEDGVGSAPGVVIPVDVRSQTVGRAIAIGHGPSGSSMTPDGHLLAVANSIDRSVSIVDLERRAVVATVPVGAGPTATEITTDGGTAWVVCSLDRTLVPIDMHSDRAGKPIQLDNAPADVIVPSAASGAWVLFPSSAGSVTFLNGHTLEHPTSVGNDPGLLIADDSTSAWVANALSDSVQHVDLFGGPSGPPIRVPRLPSDLRLTRDHRTLLVLSFGDGTHDGFLTPIDTGTSKAGTPLDVGVGPTSLTLSPGGTTAYVVNHQANAITAIDLRAWKASARIALPCSPTEIVQTPDGSTLFVDCSASSQVLPVTTARHAVGAPIAVGPSSRIVMGNTGKTVFVNGDHVLQEIDVATAKVVLSQEETGNIVSITPTPDDGTLVAVENTGGAVLLLHAATLTTTTSVSVGARPDGAQLSPDGARAYVLDTSQQKLYVVDIAAAKVTATIDVSPNATAVVLPSLR